MSSMNSRRRSKDIARKYVRNARSAGVTPVRRDLRFELPAERVHDWAGDGHVHFTHLVNALSTVIPVGERFFIDAVRQFRDQLEDPALQQAATAFIGQEAMHSREHDDYNRPLFERSVTADRFEKRVIALLGWARKHLPPSMRLSATIALEHLTAIMANGLLQDERITERAEPGYRALWQWHALEETEHKGVAFDVWEATQGRGPLAYAHRSFGLIAATTIFWGLTIPAYIGMIRDEGKLTDTAGWRSFGRMAFGEVGFLRKMVLPWFDYFRPDFHPWDDDNSRFLQAIDGFLETLEAQKLAA